MVAADVRYLPRFAILRAPGLGSAAVTVLAALGLGLAGVGASGCTVVRAHQRGHLAKRAMTDDRDSGEARFLEHERGSREGAEGGAGQPGGGCGCN
jgi:hypothetical protein